MRKVTKKSAKRRAWKAFSLYVRLKYADKLEFITCYTCNNRMHYKESQAGHGLGGRHGGILFMEELVRPQCVGCNMFGGGKYGIFTQKLIEEYGAEKYYELVKKSNQITKYTIEDYLEIENKYRHAFNLKGE